MPNTTVASTPGGLPVPKNAMIGMRYTKAGIVCMNVEHRERDRMGPLVLAEPDPSGIPKMRHRNAAPEEGDGGHAHLPESRNGEVGQRRDGKDGDSRAGGDATRSPR